LKLDRPTGRWVTINRIASNSARYIAVASPEGFVFNGRSYASMSVVSRSGDESIVAIASLVPQRGVSNTMRVVSPTTTGVRRNDPETLRIRPNATTEKVIVYYAERSGSTIRTMRCETGL
jgi:hypothetical protein